MPNPFFTLKLMSSSVTTMEVKEAYDSLAKELDMEIEKLREDLADKLSKPMDPNTQIAIDRLNTAKVDIETKLQEYKMAAEDLKTDELIKQQFQKLITETFVVERINEKINPFKMLDVNFDADDTTIKNAFRKLSLKYHPDKHPASSNLDKELYAAGFNLLREARDALLDPKERKMLGTLFKMLPTLPVAGQPPAGTPATPKTGPGQATAPPVVPIATNPSSQPLAAGQPPAGTSAIPTPNAASLPGVINPSPPIAPATPTLAPTAPVAPTQDVPQYNRILNDARGTALGDALQTNAATAKNALAPLPTVAVDNLVKSINDATTNAAIETAMKNLGLKTGQNEVRAILNENRERKYTEASNPSNPSTSYKSKIYLDHAISVKKNLYKDSGRYDTFLKATSFEVHRAEKSLDPTLGNLKKIDDKLYKLQVDLLQTQKFLIDLKNDLKNPAINATGADKDYNAYLKKMKGAAYSTFPEIIDLDRELTKISEHLKLAEKVTRQLDPILNSSAHQASTLSYYGKQNTKALYEGNDEAEAEKRLNSYLGKPSKKGGSGLQLDDKTKPLNDNILSTNKTNNIIATKIPIITENGTKLKTVTIHRHDSTKESAKSEFHFQNGVENTFKTEKRIKGEFPHSFTSVPGVATLEWAAQNIKAFQLVMPNKNDPIRIIPGTMPKECTEALIIYCKFKGFNHTPPDNFATKISDEQIKIFAKHWKDKHPEDLGKIETQRVEQKIDKPSQNLPRPKH